MNKILNDENGSIILSVVLFISISSILVTGISYLVKNQVVQFQQIQDSYEAKSMVEISEEILEKDIKSKGGITGGQIQFNSGRVDIKALDGESYELSARLINNYTFTKIFQIKKQVEEDLNIDEASNDLKGSITSEIDTSDENSLDEADGEASKNNLSTEIENSEEPPLSTNPNLNNEQSEESN